MCTTNHVLGLRHRAGKKGVCVDVRRRLQSPAWSSAATTASAVASLEPCRNHGFSSRQPGALPRPQLQQSPARSPAATTSSAVASLEPHCDHTSCSHCPTSTHTPLLPARCRKPNTWFVAHNPLLPARSRHPTLVRDPPHQDFFYCICLSIYYVHSFFLVLHTSSLRRE